MQEEKILVDFLNAFEWAYTAKIRKTYYREPDYELSFDSYGYGRGAKVVLANWITGGTYTVKNPRENGLWDAFETETVKFKHYLTSFRAALRIQDLKQPALDTLAKMFANPVLEAALPNSAGEKFAAVPAELLIEWDLAGEPGKESLNGGKRGKRNAEISNPRA